MVRLLIIVLYGTVIVNDLKRQIDTMKKSLKRRNEIMDIAVELLSERGYRDTTMLAIAQRSSSSKETLYRWFKNKRGLFEQIIKRNAQSLETALNSELNNGASVESVLSVFGYELLQLILSDEAISINRAAISESPIDATLAEVLISKGRNSTLPILTQYIQENIKSGFLINEKPTLITETFLGILLRDKQIQRLLGQKQAPSKAENKKQSIYAAKLLLRIYSNDRE